MDSAPQSQSAETVCVRRRTRRRCPRFGGGLGVLAARGTDVGADRERRRRTLLIEDRLVARAPAGVPLATG